MWGMRILLLSALVILTSVAAWADAEQAARWVERFRHTEPPVEAAGVCTGRVGDLPSFSVTPDIAGARLVRVSVPFAPAALPVVMGIMAEADGTAVAADLRVVTRHPGQPASVRRGIVTFPYAFADAKSVTFRLGLRYAPPPSPVAPKPVDTGYEIAFGGMTLQLRADSVSCTSAEFPSWSASLLAPALTESSPPLCEVVESGAHYLWLRLLVPDPAWPRIIEVRADSEGTVSVQAHVQRLGEGDAYSPTLGWRIEGLTFPEGQQHSFAAGERFTLQSQDTHAQIDFPIAPLTLRGRASVETLDGKAGLNYVRCSEDDKVPFQSTAWRSAAFVVGKPGHTPLNVILEPALPTHIAPEAFDVLYGSNTQENLSLYPLLDDVRRFHRVAMVQSALRGDDYGNVTSFNPGAPASYYGMNRLNHCPAIFEESYRASSAALRETAVQWCSNMHDLSIWWGDTPDCGGTRYNAAVAAGEKEHEGDTSYLWRTNWTSHFCTKGYDSFFYAYEETGDPRMLTALRHQVAYAKSYIHTNTGECRNIGDVVDFMRLYRFTGVPNYREEALRLFRELREKLSTGDLFDQGGKPIAEDVTFIDDDAGGLKAGYAKPYIIGYALAGLPDLSKDFPDEPKLRDVVRAVGDFLASAQDPVGGWRYPHPKSSGVIISQGIEHAMQLVRAADALEARGEDISEILNAIERTLQGRIEGYRISGQILAGLTGWERSTNAIPEGKTIYDLYTKPGDRDPSRDYTEGAVSVGGSPPDGLVHFGEVLSFYLRHRPAERLFHRNGALASVLARVPDHRLRLTPQDGGLLRAEHPENPGASVAIPALAWANLPGIENTPASEWRSDAQTGAFSLTSDQPEATYTAQFTPYAGRVECTITVWPKPEAALPVSMQAGPAIRWGGGASEGAWHTIQSPRPEAPLLAFASTDGQWVLGLASEAGGVLDSKLDEVPQRAYALGTLALNLQGPATMRAAVYIMKGTSADLAASYDADAARWRASRPSAPSGLARTAEYGFRDLLPSFNAPSVGRMQFPLSRANSGEPFSSWRNRAREAYLDALQIPPPRAPFNAEVIAEEDRGTYVARKLALNISADERVKAYLLVPKGEGPFPAIVALHDHGAHFSIGKEKVVRPFAETEERVADAVDWVTKCYGGSFIGDELARRGYIVFATDALFWGDRGRYGGVKYEDQQALGANMLHLGRSWAGTIAWDDIRSAEFVQSLAEVDAARIGCVGLSMGAHRTWSLAAATDIIKAGAAICWMCDTRTLTSPGNNQTTGQSSFSMLHPGLRAMLDYPDVASIACPKPMLFYNGTEDGLFPVPGVEASYAKMRAVWDSQGAGDRLTTKLWPVPHEFNAAMQAEAFDWMDRWLKD